MYAIGFRRRIPAAHHYEIRIVRSWYSVQLAIVIRLDALRAAFADVSLRTKPLDHDAPDFGILFLLDVLGSDSVWSQDHQSGHHDTVPGQHRTDE